MTIEAPASEPMRRAQQSVSWRWLLAILALAVALSIPVVLVEVGRPPTISYSLFLDQLDAGQVARVTLSGTEIDARLRRAVPNPAAEDEPARDRFLSRAPDFGDPALISEMRKHQVEIDVRAPAEWLSLLSRIPWPMLLLLGGLILAGIARLVRGKSAQAGSGAATMPMQGILALLSGLLGKPASMSGRPGDKAGRRDQ